MKISIITVVFNNRLHIENCINSVLDQKYNDIEYIVVDGGSTDGTVDVIRKYEKKITSWTTGRDNGIFDAMNKGIQMASGDVIGFLHSDDYYDDDEVISDVTRAFLDHDVESMYGDLLYVSKHTGKVVRYWKSGEYRNELLKRGWMPPHPTLFVRRNVYEKFGSFNTNLKVSADYDLVLRFLGTHKISTYYLPRVLVRMRLGGNSNKSIRNIAKKSLEDYQATKMNGLGAGLFVVALKNLSKVHQFFTTSVTKK